MATLHAIRLNHGNENGWKDRHNAAIECHGGVTVTGSTERAMVKLLAAWGEYASAHKRHYDSLIGDDSFLGPEWETIGDSLRGLLNGDFGSRLDGGTLDSFILDTMSENGVDTKGK